MSDTKTDLDLFLKNLRMGLKIYTATELNEAIIMALNQKHDKNSEIKFIKTQVCKEYSISERALVQSSARGAIKDARRIYCWLLHYDLRLSYRHISFRILGYKYHNRISESIKEFKTLNDKIKRDSELKRKYTDLQKQLIEFINNKQKIECA
jgi:chromosomal replication initiation ATPase DnaA